MRSSLSVFSTLLLAANLTAQSPELVVQTGHSSAVLDAVISCDRKYVLSLSHKELILWDFYGRELLKHDVEGAGIATLTFLPDGQQFLAGHLDGTISLMDLQGNRVRSYQWHNAQIAAVEIAPDGKTVLSASWDRSVQLWTLDGNKLKSFRDPAGRISSAAFSPDGTRILTGTRNHGAKLWDLNGRLLRDFQLHPGFSGACFSPDGRYILAYGSKMATLWKVTGEKVHDYPGFHLMGAFSPDEGHFLLSAYGGMIYAFDFAGNPALECQGHESNLYILRSYPEADLILSGDETGNLKLWRSDRFLRDFRGYTPPVYDADISPDGQYIALGDRDRAVKVWRIRDQGLKIFKGHQSRVNAVVFLPDSKSLLTGSETGTAITWDLNGQQLDVFQDTSILHIGDIDFTPDGGWVGATSRQGLVKLWSVPGHETVDLVVKDSIAGKTYEEFNAMDTGIGLSPSSTYNAVSFAPDGSLIAVAYGRMVVLFDRNGKDLRYIKGFPGAVNDVSFSPDGRLLLAGCSDGSLRLFTLLGAEVKILSEGNSAGVNTVDFSRDGQRMLAGYEDGMVRCWERSGRLKWGFTGHVVSIETASFVPGDDYFFTVSLDGTLKLWSWQTGEPVATFFSMTGQDNAWVQVSSENFYCGTRDLSKFVHFKIGLQAYAYDQFDLRLNRPDKVLESLLPLGAEPALIRQYRQAYHKRLEKYGFTEAMLSDDFNAPDCFITNIDDLPPTTSESTIQLAIEATDKLQWLDRVNIYVNNVPLYGTTGIDLRKENSLTYSNTLSVTLSQGVNKIEVSALNQGGGESLKATTYITYEIPEVLSDLYVLTIGVSDYQAPGKDLQYAAKDARDLAALYRSARGYHNVHVKTLTDQQATKTNILALRSWLEQSRVDDQVLLYVSGHGLIDDNYDFYYATHDTDFAHPSEKGILYDEIEGLLDGIPARKKLLLMDACHSGEYDADAPPLTAAQQDSLAQKGVSFKGFRKGDDEGSPTLGLQNSFELMQHLFADLRRGSGATVITSSAGIQVSFEDEEWQNGAFTYAFLYGLKSMKADSNQDGQVTASEIQAFVAEYVPRLTEGLQVPTFRRENLEFDFRVW